jgi:dTDP-4-amino-4,6-dideoxygalactose transaminase
MRIGRTIPPAAAPLGVTELAHGLTAICTPRRTVARREAELREYFRVSDVFLVSSGTAALTLTLLALKSLSPRTEVIVPAYTCFSVPAAVLKAGLRPVPCDIDPSNFDYDHSLLERALKSTTLCVIAHHLFGVPSNVEKVRELCRSRRIYVIEDAAQAMGIEVNGRHLGTLGDAGIFSLGRGKHLTCGSGGIVVTRSPQVAAALAREYRLVPAPTLREAASDFLKLFCMTIFIRPWLYWIPASLPFLRLGETVFPTRISVKRLSAMKAGVLENWQRRLSRANRMRVQAAMYFSHLTASTPPTTAQAYLRFPILVKSRGDRERLHASSRLFGLGVALAYPTPVSDIPEVRDASFAARKSFPAARDLVDRLLTIPTHELLSDSDKCRIAELCRSVPMAS